MSLFCEICQELIVASEDVRVTTCGHLFHFDCVTQWFSRGQNTCPHCRQLSYTSNLQKIFLTCANDEEIHLNKNCAAVKLEEDYNLAKSSLDTLKHDLDRISLENQELQLKLLSMEEFHKSEIDKITGTNIELELKLSSALTENEIKDERLQNIGDKVFSLELSLLNCKFEENENPSEIPSLKKALNDKQEQLTKANDDIKRLQLLQEILIKQNMSNAKENTTMTQNSNIRHKRSHGRNPQNNKNGKIPENFINSGRTAKESNNDNRNIKKKNNLCEIPEVLVGAILSEWEGESTNKKSSSKSLKIKSENTESNCNRLTTFGDDPW